MLPTKRLILGLRETAAELRAHPEEYEWSTSSRCNCGQLALSLGMSKSAISYLGSWTIQAIGEFCETTGMPTREVFKYLYECGIEQADYTEIEHCAFAPLAVAAWMDAKANELERRRSAEESAKRGERSEA